MAENERPFNLAAALCLLKPEDTRSEPGQWSPDVGGNRSGDCGHFRCAGCGGHCHRTRASPRQNSHPNHKDDSNPEKIQRG